MARAILKTGTKILRSNNKIFAVGEPRPPIIDLNPALISGAIDGDKIARFPDGSGNMNHALQNTSDYQGIYKANAINGLPAIEMDGVDDFFGLSNGVSLKTVLMVIRNINPTQGGYNPIFSGDLFTSVDYFDTSENSSSLFRNYMNLFATTPANRLWVNGARIEPKLNALQQTYFRLISIDVAANVDITITRLAHRVANGIGQNHWKGQYARLKIFDYRLTDRDRKDFEAELLTEYGL